MSSDSSSAANGCRICMSSLRDRVFGVTDDPSDKGAKCCVECLEGWFVSHNVSIIGRNVVQSFTVYTPNEMPIKTIKVDGGGVEPLPPEHQLLVAVAVAQPELQPIPVDDFMLIDSESSDVVIHCPIPSAPEDSVAESCDSLSSARASFNKVRNPVAVVSPWKRRKFVFGGSTFVIFILCLLIFTILEIENIHPESWVALGSGIGIQCFGLIGYTVMESMELK